MKIVLKVRQLRALQKTHGISNLLKPTPEDAEKMLNLDFLCDAVKQGLEGQTDAPDVEEMELSELLSLFRSFINGEDMGKPQTVD